MVDENQIDIGIRSHSAHLNIRINTDLRPLKDLGVREAWLGSKKESGAGSPMDFADLEARGQKHLWAGKGVSSPSGGFFNKSDLISFWRFHSLMHIDIALQYHYMSTKLCAFNIRAWSIYK